MRRFAALVEWEITHRCDLACRHCFTRRQRRGQELSPEEALELARALGGAGVEVVALSGGEPTLRADWSQLARQLAGQGVVVRLISNGQRIDRAVAREARDAGVEHVWLSLDGLERTHDALRRRRGAWRRALAAAAQLRAVGVSFGWMTTLLAVNAGELGGLASVVADSGAAAWQLWLGIPHDGSSLWLHPRRLRRLRPRLLRVARAVPQLSLGDSIGGGGLDQLRHDGRLGGCGAGREVLALLSDGSVKGCLALPASPSPRTVRDAPLAALWAWAEQRALARAEELVARCGERCCQLLGERSGGCHAVALSYGWACSDRVATLPPVSAEPRRVAAGVASLLLASSLAVGCQQERAPSPPRPASGAAPARPAPGTTPAAPARRPAPASATRTSEPATRPVRAKRPRKPPKTRRAPGGPARRQRVGRNVGGNRLRRRDCSTSHVGCRPLGRGGPGLGSPSGKKLGGKPGQGAGTKKR